MDVLRARGSRIVVGGGLAAIAAVVLIACSRHTDVAVVPADSGMLLPSSGRDPDAPAVVETKADADDHPPAETKGDADTAPSPSGRGSATNAAPPRDAGLETAGRPDSGVTAEAGANPARTVNLDEGSNGKSFDLAKGQSVVLMLSASPTSGFDWAVLKAPPALGSPTMGFVSGGGDTMGASGKRRIAWTLKDTLPAGEHAVELGYQRSFEQGAAPFKTFRFKVRAAR